MKINDTSWREMLEAACEAQKIVDADELEAFSADWRAKRSCCAMATLIHCVCIEAWSCKIHGETHRGTHD